MKTIILLLLSLCCTQAMDRFAALAMLETGNDDNAVGRAGEISRYQITVRVWRSYTSLPLESARNPFNARLVAERIMRDREKVFLRNHREVTDYDFARLWHLPFRSDKDMTAADWDYCKRFENLCERK